MKAIQLRKRERYPWSYIIDHLRDMPHTLWSGFTLEPILSPELICFRHTPIYSQVNPIITLLIC